MSKPTQVKINRIKQGHSINDTVRTHLNNSTNLINEAVRVANQGSDTFGILGEMESIIEGLRALSSKIVLDPNDPRGNAAFPELFTFLK